MQWASETIDAPISSRPDAGLEVPRDLTFGRDLLHVLQAIQDGDFSVRMAGDHDGLSAKIAEAVNVIAAANQRIAQQLERIGEQVVGRQIALQQTAAELERRLQDSEDGRKLALAAGKMGSWDWDLAAGRCVWDDGQKQIFGADPASFQAMLPNIRALVCRNDWRPLCRQLKRARRNGGAWQLEFRIRRPDGSMRWCLGTALAVRDAAGRISRIRGITMDITERKEAEDRQSLLAREVDHRTRNALAVVHAIVSLTRAADIDQFSAAVEGRIQALARAHSLLSESRWRGAKIADVLQGELAAFRAPDPERIRISGRSLSLHPSAVQALALAVHELAANAATHGALSAPFGSVQIAWEQQGDELALRWTECGGPAPKS
jgi:PAS domain S-box-containing protein